MYIDGNCDIQMAVDIIVNAKTQRPGVCNAAKRYLLADVAKNFYLGPKKPCPLQELSLGRADIQAKY